MAKSKRKAAGAAAAAPSSQPSENGPSTSGRPYTVSMGVSSSMIDNTQNIEFATFVAGQVGAGAAQKKPSSGGSSSGQQCIHVESLTLLATHWHAVLCATFTASHRQLATPVLPPPFRLPPGCF
jgi:hypothetical protein